MARKDNAALAGPSRDSPHESLCTWEGTRVESIGEAEILL